MCTPSHTQGRYIRFVVRFVLATFLVFTLLVLSPPLLALADGGGVPCTSITVEGNTLRALDACDGQWHSTSFTGTYNACWDGVVTVIDSGNVYAYVYDAIDHQWHQVLVSSSGFNFIRSHQGIIVIQIPFTLEVLAYAYDPTDHQWHSTSMAPSGFAVIMYCYDGTILMDRAYTREVLGYAYDLFDHSWHIIQMSPNGSVVTHLLDVGGVTIDRAYTREVYGYVYDFTDHQWHSKQMSFGVAPLVRWCDGGVVIVQRDVSSSNIYAYVYNANDHQWHETHIANNLCSSAPSPPTPLAAFTSTPTTGMGSLCVHFVDQSYGGSSNIQWDFGDGSASSEKSPFHTYTNPGYYTVSLRISGPGGTDIETKVNYIHVIQTPPAVSSVSPNQGTQAQTLNVTITGTSFTGATSVSFGAGITVNSFTVDSDTQITASITIAGSATPGARDVSVTAPSGTATKASSFMVNRAPPTITSVDPSGGVQGQSLSVTINGTYLIEASVVSFGSSITVNGFTVDSATQITANITISSSATPGARDISVTTLGGTATKTGGFTVNQAPPTITTVSPNSGMQGQTLSVTITGTYFTGASVVSFGLGIMVNNFSVDNSTQVSANVSISASATLGPRDVSVTTPVGTGTIASGFTITGLPPYTPSNPSPANHATGVSINADLSWTGGDPDAGDTVTYDVYFDTSSSPPLVSNDQSGTTYDPGTLAYLTKYYWQIIATDNHGASTAGPLWDFTTQPETEMVTVSIVAPPEVNTGSSFVANVTVDYVTDFDSCGFDVTYNQTIIHVTDVTGGEINSHTIVVGAGDWTYISPGLDSGKIRVNASVAGAPAPGVTGIGYIAQIHFNVVGSPCQTSAIHLEKVGMYDYQAKGINTATVDDSVHVAFAPLEITTTALPEAKVGDVYTATLVATSGKTPYTWTATGLPAGLTCSAAGVISGTPTTSGDFSVNATVTDSFSPPNIVSKVLSLKVYLALGITTTSPLPEAKIGYAYTANLVATGGKTPYTWTATGLPAGLTCSAAGVISGTPTASGDFSVNATVTDSFSPPNIVSKGLSLEVYADLGITTTSLPDGKVGQAYTATLVATGGKIPYTWMATGLPAGLTCSVAGVISGTSTSGGHLSVNATVTDSFSPPNIVWKILDLSVCILGDANGDGVVDTGDITKVKRIYFGLDSPTPCADVNGDGLIDTGDITAIKVIYFLLPPRPP